MGTAYGQRPSSFLDMAAGSWEAYDVDLACLHVGRDVEERIRKKKPLPWATGKPRAGQSFGKLGGRARKVRIPESGVW